MSWRIIDNEYDKYYESFRNQLSEIDTKLAMLQDAEDNYYITAKYILELANRAYDLFISSEVEERRYLAFFDLARFKLLNVPKEPALNVSTGYLR